MKRTTYAAAGIVLALTCALAFTGCPQEAGDPEIDSGLVHKWTDNGDPDFYLERKFEIKSDGSFTANLNPLALGAYAGAGGSANEATAKGAAKTTVDAVTFDSSWQVTGKLTQVEGTLYKMDDLKARASDQQVVPGTPPTITPANNVIGTFSGQNINIIIADGGNSFVFSHGGTGEVAIQINIFFGGTYNKAD